MVQLHEKTRHTDNPAHVLYVAILLMIQDTDIHVCLCCVLKILAIYDRFGRLSYGSEKLAKDCLEYVVFEKHIADEYGCWRLHGKILPDWLPGQQPVLRTMRRPDFVTPDSEAAENDVHTATSGPANV